MARNACGIKKNKNRTRGTASYIFRFPACCRKPNRPSINCFLGKLRNGVTVIVVSFHRCVHRRQLVFQKLSSKYSKWRINLSEDLLPPQNATFYEGKCCPWLLTILDHPAPFAVHRTSHKALLISPP